MSTKCADYRLLAAQREIWLAQKIAPDNHIYNFAECVTIDGAIDPALFAAALRQVLAETESLWVRIVEYPEGPRQVLDRSESWSMPFFNLSGEADPLEAAKAWMKADLAQPVDLTRGPLFNFALFKASSEQFLFYQRSHHIINDGFGMMLIFRRVAEVYTSLVGNLPDAGNAFGSLRALLEEEERYRASKQFVEDREYWLKCLADLPEPVYLLDQRSGISKGLALHTTSLPRAVVDKLREFARQTEASLPRLMVSGMAAYTMRLTGTNEVILGLVVSARVGEVSRNIPGMLSNVLPLRLRTLPEMTFSELIRQVGQKMREALRGQRYRGEDLRRELGLCAANQRLYGPTVNIIPFVTELRFAGHRARTNVIAYGAGGDFSIGVYYGSDHGELRIDFTGGSSLDTNEALLIHKRGFLRFLEASVNDAEQRIGRIDLLKPEERRQILEEWNQTAAPYRHDLRAHQIFEGQVASSPCAVAISDDDGELTYDELNRRSNQLAHYLRRHGVGPESVLGICGERSAKMVIGLLGALKAGGGYLPLDPTYPRERLSFMLEDSGARVLLTEEHLLDALPAHGARVVCLDIDWGEIAAESEENPVNLTAPANLAYLIYTSGSTAAPKGVALAHEGISNLVTAQARAFGVGGGSRVLQFSSFSFDASVWEMVMSLLTGATLCISRRRASLFDGKATLQMLREQAITTATMPPTVLAVLPPAGLPDLRTLISAGESCSAEIIRRWAEGRDFFNAYGPTESTVCASMAKCDPADGRPPSIGRPLANMETFVIDRHGDPAQVGVPGELYIGGVGLARGYHKRPGRTALQFVPHPFAPRPGSRLYRTGDLVRYLPDGNIDFLGRIDFQVKLRGFRIELEEIEGALSEHPAVCQNVVVACADRRGEKRLVAYIVAREGKPPTIEELRDFLGEKLPEYMAPSAFVLLDAFHLTSNGKIDRKALPDPDDLRPNLATAFVRPQTKIEREIAEIWCEALGIERVGIDDNFFDLGGDSLRLQTAHLKLQERLCHELLLVTLFKYPTVRALANHLSVSRNTEEPSPDREQKWRTALKRRGTARRINKYEKR